MIKWLKKVFFYSQGFEPGMPAQVCSVITTTPLKVTRRGMNNFKLFLPDCL